jgi:hypothetical protein
MMTDSAIPTEPPNPFAQLPEVLASMERMGATVERLLAGGGPGSDFLRNMR